MCMRLFVCSVLNVTQLYEVIIDIICDTNFSLTRSNRSQENVCIDISNIDRSMFFWWQAIMFFVNTFSFIDWLFSGERLYRYIKYRSFYVLLVTSYHVLCQYFLIHLIDCSQENVFFVPFALFHLFVQYYVHFIRFRTDASHYFVVLDARSYLRLVAVFIIYLTLFKCDWV